MRGNSRWRESSLWTVSWGGDLFSLSRVTVWKMDGSPITGLGVLVL